MTNAPRQLPAETSHVGVFYAAVEEIFMSILLICLAGAVSGSSSSYLRHLAARGFAAEVFGRGGAALGARVGAEPATCT